MSQPVARTGVVAEALTTPLTFFRNKIFIEGMIASYAVQVQEIETVAAQLFTLLSIDRSEGVQLDRIGRIVGESRKARTDAQYRLALKAQIRINKSTGTVDDINAIFRQVFGKPCYIQELTRAAMEVEMSGASVNPSDELAAAESLISMIKGGGTSARILWHEAAEDDTIFQLAAGDVEESSTTQGLADVAETTGGLLLDIYEGA